jgi:hypothetical protein
MSEESTDRPASGRIESTGRRIEAEEGRSKGLDTLMIATPQPVQVSDKEIAPGATVGGDATVNPAGAQVDYDG